MRKILSSTLLFLLPVLSAFAQQRNYTTKKVDASSIRIDGKIDEAIWNEVAWSGNFVQFEPEEGKEPSQKTEFKVIYDDNYIYFAFKAYDTEPEKIVKRLSRRDNIDGDVVVIQIDSYYDKKTAFMFAITAAGVRYDAVVSNDGEDEDETWDPIWTGKAFVSDFGWSTELKIPLSQLRFGKKENQVWGLEVGRIIFRNNETNLWQPISKEESGWVSRFATLTGLKNLKPKRQIEIAPYVSSYLNVYEKEEENPFADGSNVNINGGIDGKIGVTNDLTLDFTINPDFGQVEADPSEVNLTAFETFFNEKRPFFVEGANITDYSITPGGNPWASDNLFYSRRLGRSPHYNPDLTENEYAKIPGNTRILGALKLTGKTKSGLSIGIIESFTNKEYALIDLNGNRRREEVEPYTNYFAGRIQKDMNDGNTIFGGMITSVNRFTDKEHFDFLTKNAYTGGLDFRQYFKDKKYSVSLELIGSHIEGSTEAILIQQESSRRYYQRPDADYLVYDTTRTSLSGHGGNINFSKQVNKGLSFSFNTTWRSPGIELNDIGYIRRANSIFQYIWAGYNITEPFSIFRSMQFNFNQWSGIDFGGNLNFFGGNINSWIQFKNLWSISFSINSEGFYNDNSILRGGPSMKMPKNFSYNFFINSNETKKLSFGGGYSQSLVAENAGNYSSIFGFITYKPVNFLSISLSPEYSKQRSNLQYVDEYFYNDANQYLFGEINQEIFNITTRFNITITPDFTIQYYGAPFIAAAVYSNFKKITDPKANIYSDRYHAFTSEQIELFNEGETYRISELANGIYDYNFDLPDFNYKQFRSNLVLRWEYNPGSILYFVWSQDKTEAVSDGKFNLGSDLKNMFKIKANDVFLIKLSYRFIL